MSTPAFGGTQGGHVMEGAKPEVINSGMPSGGSPGDGDLSGVGFAGEHSVGGPVSGSGVIK